MHPGTLKPVWSHLRIPFSWRLLPVAIFSLSQSDHINFQGWVLLLVLAMVIYPASHAFNSYYDRDEGSIGGLEFPPPVPPILLPISWTLDATGLALALLLGESATIGVLAYTLVSKAYSHPSTRWKAHPIWGWFVVSFFQGSWIYLVVQSTCSGTSLWNAAMAPRTGWAMVLSFLLIGAGYPLTQIYQHHEDRQRGDETISLLLGHKGTYVFCLLAAGALQCVAIPFFISLSPLHLFLFELGLLPGAALLLRNSYLQKNSYASANDFSFWGATAMNLSFLLMFFA